MRHPTINRYTHPSIRITITSSSLPTTPPFSFSPILRVVPVSQAPSDTPSSSSLNPLAPHNLNGSALQYTLHFIHRLQRQLHFSNSFFYAFPQILIVSSFSSRTCWRYLLISLFRSLSFEPGDNTKFCRKVEACRIGNLGGRGSIVVRIV